MTRQLGRLLVHCLHEATSSNAAPLSVAGLSASDLRLLPAAADYHGVAPAVNNLLGRSDALPAEVAAQLEEAYRRQWQVHLRALADLPELVGLLDRLGIPAAVVKGPVLVEGIYRRVDVRSYVDLDVLVHRTDLPTVIEALEKSNASLLDRNWTMIRSQVRGELSLILRHGTLLDLHWHPFNEPRVRRAFSVSTRGMLDRARRMSVNGTSTPTLDAEDTLIYLAAHAGLAGGYRLVWFKDLEQAIVNDPPDWDEVIGRARASGLSLLISTMLGRARRIMGAPVPPEVLASLAPPGWRSVIGMTDRVSPPQRSFGHKLTARTAIAATRRSGLASVAELSRVLWTDIARPLLADPTGSWRRLRLSGDAGAPAPNPLFKQAGDPEDREAFLNLVSRSRTDP